jgi:hypothetical protein
LKLPGAEQEAGEPEPELAERRVRHREITDLFEGDVLGLRLPLGQRGR